MVTLSEWGTCRYMAQCTFTAYNKHSSWQLVDLIKGYRKSSLVHSVQTKSLCKASGNVTLF